MQEFQGAVDKLKNSELVQRGAELFQVAGQVNQDLGVQNHFDKVWNPELPKVPSMF